MPAEAEDALENDPSGMILTIMKMRGFSRAKEALERAKTKEDVPQSGMMDLLLDIEFEEAEKELKGHGG